MRRRRRKKIRSITFLVKYIDVFMIAFDMYICRICNEFQVDAIDIQYILIKVKEKEKKRSELFFYVFTITNN